MASKTIPEKFLDLLPPKKPLASIATIMSDGTPQVTPVWFDYTNGKIRINTARGRVKAKNMKVGSKVALAIIDPDNVYRYIGIRGPVISEDEKNADAHIDSLAKKYLNQDKYPFRTPGEKRVTYVIDKQGKIAAIHIGLSGRKEFEDGVDELLEEGNTPVNAGGDAPAGNLAAKQH